MILDFESSFKFRLVFWPVSFLFLRRIFGMLPWYQLRFLFILGSEIIAQRIEIEWCCKRFELLLNLDLASTFPARTEASRIFLAEVDILEPNSLVKFCMVIVSLMQKYPSIRENPVAIINSQPGGQNGCYNLAIIVWPSTIRSRVRFTNANSFLQWDIPYLHFSV